MDPRWQSTTHVQQPDPVPLSAISEHLRTRLVELVLDEVSAGHWSPLRAAQELRAFGFAASAEKVKAAMTASTLALPRSSCTGCARGGASDRCRTCDPRTWLVSRLARPVGTLTKARAS